MAAGGRGTSLLPKEQELTQQQEEGQPARAMADNSSSRQTRAVAAGPIPSGSRHRYRRLNLTMVMIAWPMHDP